MRPPDRAREALCFDVLRGLPRAGIVLIGGYAVGAYGPPRFSVDLDLVLREPSVPRVREVLRRSGFLRVGNWKGGAVFAGGAERWTHGAGPLPVSADLLIGGVSDRVSGAAHSFAELRRASRRRTIRGMAASSVAEATVPDREILIGLKLEVGRLVDLRDVAILAGDRFDLRTIASFLRRTSVDVLEEHARTLLSVLDTPNFRNSLKGVYMLDDRAFRRYAEGARRLVLGLLQEFSTRRERGPKGTRDRP